MVYIPYKERCSIYEKFGLKRKLFRMNSEYTETSAKSLIRGLLVLECFSPTENSFSLSELSKRMNIPKSSLYRVVKALSQMNYLRYDVQSKRYYLGMRVLSLGFSLLQGMELRDIARPYMEVLSRESNKTVNLAILDKDEMVYIERIRVPSIRAFNVGVGNRIPPWNTAVGRAFIAFLEKEKVEAMLKKTQESQGIKIDEDALAKSLADVRRNGFATNDQEFQSGILAVAVPVFSSRGIICAINLVTEPEDVSIDVLKTQYAPKLLKIGRELSEALGYRPETHNIEETLWTAQ